MKCSLLLVLVAVTATRSPIHASPVTPALPDAMIVVAPDAAPTNPALVWVVRGAGLKLLRWVGEQIVDQAVDYAVTRTGVKDAVWHAMDNLLHISNDTGVAPEIRTELVRIRGEFATYHRILADHARSDAETRRQLLALRRDFVAYVQQTNRRLEVLDARISAVEREQRRHLKMIIDLEGRVGVIEGRLVDAEGRITTLDGRVTVIESEVERHRRIIDPDPNRFLRHEAYLAGGLLYANSPALGGEAAVGGEITAQYNFNQYLGVFAGVAYMPLTASDVDSVADGTSVTWDNANVHLGATASLLNPLSPVSVQLGAGGGIASSRLMYYPEGVERTSENGQELGSSSNVYLLVKAEIGVAPPAYTFEPIATVGYMTFMEDVAYTGSEVSSNVGRNVWFVSLGVRFRQYLRGTDRQDLPAGVGNRRR